MEALTSGRCCYPWDGDGTHYCSKNAFRTESIRPKCLNHRMYMVFVRAAFIIQSIALRDLELSVEAESS